MKKYLITIILIIMTFGAGTIYGLLMQKYKLFPYKISKMAYYRVIDPDRFNVWSIGIYEGSSIFDLKPPEDISNPVLTAKDVTDIEASFVADPFMISKDGMYFMFFEVLNQESWHGDIAYAESSDGRDWNYRKVVIDEDFHLSYPYVFEWENNYYLIPESHEDFSVRLYKATKFPEKWEHVGNILSGYEYDDPSIFRYKGKWWMFASTGGHSILDLYFSDELLTGWTPHPMNPLVRFDKHYSTPGGRVITYDDKLYRLTQDDDPSYGIQVFAFEITELSETTYSDKLASKKPIITKSGVGWNSAGMHHVDLHKIGNKWMSVVDGRNK